MTRDCNDCVFHQQGCHPADVTVAEDADGNITCADCLGYTDLPFFSRKQCVRDLFVMTRQKRDPLYATPPESLQAPDGANAKQVAGDHYAGAIQPWDFIVANGLSYLEGNVVKYVCRHARKNGKQDLEKAMHYLQKLIEVTYP